MVPRGAVDGGGTTTWACGRGAGYDDGDDTTTTGASADDGSEES
jgi:hypothetical protein